MSATYDLLEEPHDPWPARIAAAAGRLVSRHPSVAAGGTAFLVVFSFVSANAIWFQPGDHPAPLFSTRDTMSVGAVPRDIPVPLPREDGISVPVTEVQTTRITPDSATAASGTDDGLTVDELLAGNGLIRRIQDELARRGLYDGEVDGLMGPLTSAAIAGYQEKHGLEADGKASAALLDHMTGEEGSAPDVALPEERPNEIAGAAAAADSALVKRIQRGLANIAYEDIEVDGIVGAKTRDAISRFQKHYRLPVTGEPSEAVLDKLVEIGALSAEG